METKVSALNNLLHTKPSSSSSSPNSVHKHKRTSVKKMIKKISSSKKSKKISEQRESEQLLKHGELISDEFTAFNEWLEKGSPLSADTMGANPFINSIFMSQINPCLQFKNEQVIQSSAQSIHCSNTVSTVQSSAQSIHCSNTVSTVQSSAQSIHCSNTVSTVQSSAQSIHCSNTVSTVQSSAQSIHCSNTRKGNTRKGNTLRVLKEVHCMLNCTMHMYMCSFSSVESFLYKLLLIVIYGDPFVPFFLVVGKS